MMTLRSLLFAIMLATMSACGTTPLPDLPVDDVVASWDNVSESDAASWPELQWWLGFNSQELTGLMAVLEAQSLDLANNYRNLQRAQLALREAGFDLYPTPLLEVGAARRYTGENLPGTSYRDTTSGSADLSLGIVYADVISKPSRYAAATADFDASVAAIAETRLSTYATAASTYFQILLLRDRISAAEQNLANAQAIQNIVAARVAAGTVAPIDGLQQRIAVQRQINNIQSLRQSEYEARSSLALLLAQSVQRFDVQAETLDQVEVPAIVPGIPAELLVRRPDLVQAESELRLSRANVDLVRTAFLPNISLTATAGLGGNSVDDLLSAETMLVAGTAGIVQTLLDNGARRRNAARAELDLETALANYRRSVIAAFNEVEVGLANIKLLDDLALFARADLARAEEAFRIAEVRYREGVDDFQTVLTTQNTLFGVRNNYYDNKLARLNAVVALYQSLGGGWDNADPIRGVSR